MKLNSKLWMLAVALATVGCQDDLNNGPDNSGLELEGEKAKISVAVNTGITTRANPTPGEEGDGDEPGTVPESFVKDVTIFLFRNAENGVESTTDFAFKSSSVIAAAGYAETDDPMLGGSTEHSYYKEVEVTVTDPASDLVDGNPYGVITIANIGKTNSDALIKAVKDGSNKGSVLADYFVKDLQVNGNFIMSTHTMGGTGTGLAQSIVTPKVLTGSEEAPLVNVYVERLAAKVRINEYKDNNFVYSLNERKVEIDNVETTVQDAVILNNVVVVNQLEPGSYLIKRVSKTYDGETGDLGADDAASDTYLGDEFGDATSPATNFVIDPWTRGKTADKIHNIEGIMFGEHKLSYINPITEEDTYPQLWNGWTATKTALYNNADVTDDDQEDLDYIRENTTSAVAQKNGYSTGAVFEATYYPAAWVVADAKDKIGYKMAATGCITTSSTPGEGGEGSTTTTSYTAKPFYLYNNAVFENQDAILAYCLGHVIPDGILDTELDKYFTYADFSGENMANFDLEKFQSSPSAGATDPFGYIAYLNDLSLTTPAKDIPTFAAFMNSGDSHLVKEPESVKAYNDGKCYYPYWIRHANNNNPDQTTGVQDMSKRLMGIMEFGIVRNNIYDLTVTGINGFGSVDIPDVDEDDEHTKLGIRVVLYVKDWTLRKNDNIYL